MTRSIYQLSLVAFYEEKDNNVLWGKINKIQSIILNDISNNYKPYKMEQIHGTIIGLEGAILEGNLIGKNYKEIENKEVRLDIRAIINFVLETKPIKIKIGGFNNNDNDIFTSRGETPFNRSFSIQRNIIVAMGWPYSNGNYSPVLDTMRRRLSKFGALHKYYNKPNSHDNDFFFVLGNLKAPLNDTQKNSLLLKIQKEMTDWENITAEINTKNISIIKYEDTKFKNATSLKLEDALEQIELLENSYPEFNYAANWLNTPEK